MINILLIDAKNDLNAALDDILNKKAVSPDTLAELAARYKELPKLIGITKDKDERQDIEQTINLIFQTLKIYDTEKDILRSVKIRDCTKIRLNKIASSYDAAINILLDAYES